MQGVAQQGVRGRDLEGGHLGGKIKDLHGGERVGGATQDEGWMGGANIEQEGGRVLLLYLHFIHFV
jgi:hypothetical protein